MLPSRHAVAEKARWLITVGEKLAMLPLVFVAKLTDPIIAILSVSGGLAFRAWWHLAATALAATMIQEILLGATQVTRSFNPISFAIGLVAAGAWTMGAYYVKRRWQGRTKGS
jgi:hypothetical protein